MASGRAGIGQRPHPLSPSPRRPRRIAIVRPPSAALARCELTHLARHPIDVARAVAQHATYAALLRDLGAEVEVLPPEPDLPDAVFVEDVAVVLDELAVITNPGAPSRRPEVDGVAAAVARHRPVHRMPAPATLDGGDIVVVDRTLYVGRSTRTNPEGVAWLRAVLGPYGYTVTAVDLGPCLHLKSACTYLGEGVVLTNPGQHPSGGRRDRHGGRLPGDAIVDRGARLSGAGRGPVRAAEGGGGGELPESGVQTDGR